jgi:hypothetical protein
MGIAEFIIGPAEGRTRWLRPSYGLPSRSARMRRKQIWFSKSQANMTKRSRGAIGA